MAAVRGNILRPRPEAPATFFASKCCRQRSTSAGTMSMSTTKRACLAWAACAAAMAASFTYGLAGVIASRSTDASIELTPGTTIDLTVFRFFEDDLEFVLSFTDHCAELGSWV